jgi:hypothetical protein
MSTITPPPGRVADSTRQAGPRPSDRGQILVLFAGGLLAFLAMAGLVLDTGFAFFGRRDAQNVSDLASVAGTRKVAEGQIADPPDRSSATVYQEVAAVVAANGCDVAAGCSWSAEYVDGARSTISPVANSGTFAANVAGVRVSITRPTPTVIVGPVLTLLGQSPIDSWNVQTVATALSGSTRSLGGAGQLLPIALLEPTDPVTGDPIGFQEGREYEVTDAALDSPGSFGWLSWTGSNAATTLENSVCTPDNPTLTLPQWISNSPGAKNKGGVSGSGIRGCLEYYLDNQIPVLVPVYGTGCSGTTDVIQGGGANTEYCIVGVVEMQLTDLNYAPVVKSIKAFFKKTFAYQPGTVPGGVTLGPPTSGETSYFLGLVQ